MTNNNPLQAVIMNTCPLSPPDCDDTLRGPPGLDDYSISQCLKTHVWPL